MRLHYVSKKMDFLGAFYKLLNNGIYGWICKSPEKYQETRLLFSSAESYDYFESKNTNLETPITIFEKVAKTINNPHDSLADKIQEIQNAYDKQISEAEKKK